MGLPKSTLPTTVETHGASGNSPSQLTTVPTTDHTEETSDTSRNSPLQLTTLPTTIHIEETCGAPGNSQSFIRVFRQGDQGEETLGSDLGDGLSQELSITDPSMGNVLILGLKKPRKYQTRRLEQEVVVLKDKLDESEKARTRQLAQCTKLLSGDLCRRCGHRSIAISNDGIRIGFALLFFNTFSDGHSGLPEQKWAKFDGKLLKSVLEEVGYEVKLVFDSEEDEMLRELRAVEEKINASDRNVIVFFSTHGGLKESAADDSSEEESEGERTAADNSSEEESEGESTAADNSSEEESEGESTAADNSSEKESEGKNKSLKQGEFIRDSTGRKIFNLEGVLDTHLGNCKGKHILVGVDSCRGKKVHKANEPLPINRTILYSCMPGYTTHWSSDWGSPFVIAFCREALDCTRNSDISTFVRRVIGGVSREKLTDWAADGKTTIRVAQVPEVRTTAAENEEAIYRRNSF